MNEETKNALMIVNKFAMQRAEELYNPDDEKPGTDATIAMLVAKWCHDEVAIADGMERAKAQFIAEEFPNMSKSE